MATQTRPPSGQGTVEWTPSSGFNWQCVSDGGDTDYVSSYETAVIDYYTYDAFDFVGSSVNKLSCYIRYKDDGSSYVYAASIIINGSYYYGPVKYGGATYADYTHDWLTNPNTSAAWTIDELNGIGTGGIDDWRLRGDADAGVTVYVSRYELIADYEAAASDYPLAVDSGVVTTDGTAVSLLAARLMAAATGSVTTDGTATGLLADRTMASASGAVTTDGTAIGLLADRIMASAPGAVTTDGTAVDLLKDLVLTATSGAVTTDGTVVDLLKDLILATASGAVTTDGTAIGMFRGKGLTAVSGAVTTDGTAVSLLATRTVGATAGAVTTDGTALGLIADRIMASGAGTVTVTGTAVGLLADRMVPVSSGTVTVTGSDLALWLNIILGEYPDLVTAARHRVYTPETLCDRIAFTVEITGGDYVVTREIDLLCGVVAGQDKTVERNSLVCPFFDALFSLDGDLISAVNYKVDSGSKTAIPAAYGTALTDRARSFSLSFSSAGEKRLTLYVTDNDSNEYSDSLIVRVS